MWTRLRNYFLTGVVITAPIGATIWIVWSVIDWIDSIVTPLIPAQANPESYLRFTIPGFGVVAAVILLTAIGFLAANLVGRTLLRGGEKIVDRVPVIRVVYRAIKQIAETVLADRTKNFKNVGLIEYPRKGLFALCLVTTESRGEVARRVGEGTEKVYACVVPPSPVPTAGMLLFVRESELTILDMTVEEGVKMIVSMGLVVPDPAALPRLEKKPRGKAAVAQPGPEEPAPAE
ncbi:MAG: DUF502 domain-containing protein [Bauldia sp.]